MGARQTMVDGGGGLPIATYEFGDGGSRRPVLFIHGFMQSHKCWGEQTGDPALLEDRRVAAIDLRGHGESSRALPEPVAEGVPPGHLPQHWGDDVAAVIAALGLDRPVLVGWSYGGFVMGDYVRTHGADAIDGVVFAGAACRYNPPEQEDSFIGPGFLEPAPEMLGPEPGFSRATEQFLRNCFHHQLDDDAFAYHLEYNLAVPAENRMALLSRGPEKMDAEIWPDSGVRALVIHGAQDDVVYPASGEALAAATGGRLELYEDCAHAPFLEHPERFTADLLAFLE